jgi:diadenosine tetraphosphate (Ap4A) HIT family hydrolase
MIDSDKSLGSSSYFLASLHENQCYLGRMRITAKRKDAVGLFTLTEQEALDFFRFGAKIEEVLGGLFNPDLYNYFVGGNRNPHFHLHLIPRYREPRIFANQTFTDANWGQNYTPYDREFEIADETFLIIRDAIRKGLV